MNAKRIQNNDDEGVPAKNVEFIKKILNLAGRHLRFCTSFANNSERAFSSDSEPTLRRC